MIERLEWLERRIASLERAVASAESVAAQAMAATWQLGGGLTVGIGGGLRFRWAKTTDAIDPGSGNPATDPLVFGEGPITFYDNESGDLLTETGTGRNAGLEIATSRVVGVVGVDGGPWDVIVDLCDA